MIRVNTRNPAVASHKQATFGPLEADDVPRVARLMYEAFNSGPSLMTAVAQKGYKEYLKLVIRHPAQFPGREYTVARVDGVIAAVAETQTRNSTVHLNRICVDSRFAGAGLAKALIQHVDLASQSNGSVMWTLDVFDDNARALRLYRSLGLKIVYSTRWWVSRMPPADSPEPLPEFPQIAASISAFGFSPLHGPWEGSSIVGDTVRVPSRDRFEQADALARLRATFPGVTRCLLIERVRDGLTRPPTGVKQAYNAMRMAGIISPAAR